MTVFIAGGSGTIGLPLVRALVSAGHRVLATTRSLSKQDELQRHGATPIVMDALDGDAVERAVRAASPTAVIHELTALPVAGPRRARDLRPTNRLRMEGTRHLLRAATAAGARRFIGGSFAPLGAAPALAGAQSPHARNAAEAVQSMESQILDAARAGAIEGIVLRYGMFYGTGNPGMREMTVLARRRRLPVIRRDRGLLPFVHLDDAVAATVAALDRGSSGAVYDIVDDHPVSFSDFVQELAANAGAPRPLAVPLWVLRLAAPYMAHLLSMRLSVSNAKARADLGWAPIFPSYREGLRQTPGRGGSAVSDRGRAPLDGASRSS